MGLSREVVDGRLSQVELAQAMSVFSLGISVCRGYSLELSYAVLLFAVHSMTFLLCSSVTLAV